MMIIRKKQNDILHMEFATHCHPRLDCSGGGGSKVLTPIRPVACLGGNLDVGEQVVRLV